jgi:hypothetical protein
MRGEPIEAVASDAQSCIRSLPHLQLNRSGFAGGSNS